MIHSEEQQAVLQQALTAFVEGLKSPSSAATAPGRAHVERQILVAQQMLDDLPTNQEFMRLAIKHLKDASIRDAAVSQSANADGAAWSPTPNDYKAVTGHALAALRYLGCASTAPTPEELKLAQLKVFEVTAAGFSVATHADKDLVFWVAASSADVVFAAIQGTGATFRGEILGWKLSDAIFMLPEQTGQFVAALRAKADGR